MSSMSISSSTTPTPSVGTTVASSVSAISHHRVLKTRDEVMPFMNGLTVLDDKLREIMDDYGQLTKRGAEVQIKLQKYQDLLRLKVDEKFELEQLPDITPARAKKITSLRNSINYYTGKISIFNEVITSINIQIEQFQIVDKRANHMIELVNLFDEFKIPIVDKLNLMMANTNINKW